MHRARLQLAIIRATSREALVVQGTANLRTNIMDFRGFDSSIILIVRGGIPRPIGDSPESLSQAILEGIMLVGRLGVFPNPLGIQTGGCSGKGVQWMGVVLCNKQVYNILQITTPCFHCTTL